MGEIMNIAIIIAPENYQDKEFEIPYKIFLDKGFKAEVFSTKIGICKGKLGGFFDVKKNLSQLNIKDFDALFIVGGPGAIVLRKNELVNKIINDFNKNNKIIGAICIAPTILANSGVLKGKKSTVWLGFDQELNMNTDTFLEKKGAIFVNNPVVNDGNFISGNGPGAAEEFGNTMVAMLSK